MLNFETFSVVPDAVNKSGAIAVLLLTALILSTAGTGCSQNTDADRAANHSPSQPSAGEEEVLRSQPKTQAELAAHYPNLNLNDVCVADDRCNSPLRCLGGECRFPQAMTGDVDKQTPRAKIQKADGGLVAFSLELAQNRAELSRGLMHREHMQADFGMLFIFEEEQRQSFWMKNTLIPLDMLFIRRDGVIDTIIERAAPRSLSPRESRGKTLYVLELTGGEAARQGIQVGDLVSFEGIPSIMTP